MTTIGISPITTLATTTVAKDHQDNSNQKDTARRAVPFPFPLGINLPI